MIVDLLGTIPSPPFKQIDIWPRPLSMYGLSIGLGIILATVVARRRMADRRIHPDTALDLLIWIIPAGLIGARIYHIVTEWLPVGNWIEFWEGGLGIPGAIAGGAIAALVFIRHRGLPRPQMVDALAPGVVLAQGIGRWGNWWNQELYGRATDLPWALEIRTGSDSLVGTFHPTFLYEFFWCLIVFGFLLWIDGRKVLRPGKLVWVYTGMYALGRLVIESIRIDPANEILGLRVNHWTMGIVVLVSLFMLRNARRKPDTFGDGFVVDDEGKEPGATDYEGDEAEEE